MRNKEISKKHLEEIYGISLIAFAILLMVCILTSATGIIGHYVVISLKYLVGSGRFLIPIFLAIWGVLFLLHRFRINLEWVGLGLALCFVSIVSIVHLSTPALKEFEPKFLFSHGGFTGACLSYVLRTLLGTINAYILLSALLIIGTVFCTGISISDLFSRTAEGSKFVLFTFKKALRKAHPEREQITVYPEPELKEEPKTIGKPELETPIVISQDAFMKETTQLAKKLGKRYISSEIYQLPPPSFLKRTPPTRGLLSKKNIKESIRILERTLQNFDVDATVSKVIKGPTVTRFEIQLATGVKVNRVLSLADDIALALATADVRILAPIPGKSAIGIEVPNQYRELVTLGDVLSTPEAREAKGLLTIGVGKDIAGQPVLANLGEMPHLLIAGATGSGKSVCINSLLTSLIMRARPVEVKMILIDPKRIELASFRDIPHLITPVVTHPKQAASVLTWAVEEMEERFKTLAEVGARNIDGYNVRVKDTDKEPMPYIVIVIDELADLMMVSPGEVEDAICRIAQLARAVGIHLVIATQRPSVDIITGLIKANITSRIAFAVSSQTDSRVILDMGGAEKLVGKGDMLFITAGSKPRRIQGSFVTEPEIEMITNFIKKQAKPEYKTEILEEHRSKLGYDYEDELLDQAMELVVTTGQASISMLQRRLRVGYARAARLIDMLEERGIVGGYEGSKPRAVLITLEELERIKRAREQ
ncbi:MAG: DNA translocase FtsK 4TM domain-containing protein [Actinomycetota bacterium]|nr:DNA translocase FtsK 4TM domain-containing protein [Actinomycetota bacterium]